jgi:hypothetical protein
MTVAVAVSMISVPITVSVVSVVHVVKTVAVSRRERATEWRSITLRSHRGDAGARTINGIAAETRGGHGRGCAIDLGLDRDSEEQHNRQSGQKRDRR